MTASYYCSLLSIIIITSHSNKTSARFYMIYKLTHGKSKIFSPDCNIVFNMIMPSLSQLFHDKAVTAANSRLMSAILSSNISTLPKEISIRLNRKDWIWERHFKRKVNSHDCYTKDCSTLRKWKLLRRGKIF